jgi:RimJ/RimL family protein N-acetyltransferase
MNITLREYNQGDIERLEMLANNPNVAKFLADAFPSPYTLEAAQWWINTGSKDGITRAIEYEGLLVGGVGAIIQEAEHRKQAAVGYWLGEPYWGNGLAAAALELLVSHVFESTEIIRFYASVYSANIASIRVLEKASFEREAILKRSLFKQGQFYDEHIYTRFKP